MTAPTDFPRLPLSARPIFARKLLAVWRLHHLAAGEEVSILVRPGEWPTDIPAEIKGVPVRESDWVQGDGSVWVLGRKADGWYGCYQMAAWDSAEMSVDELAIITAYVQVPHDQAKGLRIWLHPSPETGEVPMWEKRRG